MNSLESLEVKRATNIQVTHVHTCNNTSRLGFQFSRGVEFQSTFGRLATKSHHHLGERQMKTYLMSWGSPEFPADKRNSGASHYGRITTAARLIFPLMPRLVVNTSTSTGPARVVSKPWKDFAARSAGCRRCGSTAFRPAYRCEPCNRTT